MALSYKTEVLTQLIADEVAARGRGSQTRLAEAVGVEVQTVNKWVKGQTTPTPDKWPAIEAFFGWPPGEISSRVVPAGSGASTADRVSALTDEVAGLQVRLQMLESTLRRALGQETPEP